MFTRAIANRYSSVQDLDAKKEGPEMGLLFSSLLTVAFALEGT
jgi:hypothetical protein